MVNVLCSPTNLLRHANSGSCGLDIINIQSDATINGNIVAIETGLTIEIQPGYYGKVEARSSLALKGMIILGGIIDSDYRETIKLLATNVGDEITIAWGYAICPADY